VWEKRRKRKKKPLKIGKNAMRRGREEKGAGELNLIYLRPCVKGRRKGRCEVLFPKPMPSGGAKKRGAVRPPFYIHT